MARFLVTPSLHSSWRWYIDSDADNKKEFLDVLNKTVREPSKEMLLGRKFEEDVYRECDGAYQATCDIRYDMCVSHAAEMVRDGLRQEKVYLPTRIGNRDVILYGKADIIHRNWIYDLKRLKNYDVGKFASSIQHMLYMHCSNIANFGYIITDGSSLWEEDYRLNDDMLAYMNGEIATMLDCIFDHREFRDAYVSHWTSRPMLSAAAAAA